MSRSQRDRCEERFHAHHSGTYSASAETVGPDELLALAPNEFVRPETFLQALYVPVSSTHLTLPTIIIVYISVGAVSHKKKLSTSHISTLHLQQPPKRLV